MVEYNIEVAKKGVAKITVETDDYKIYRDVLDALTKETDKRVGYTTARPVNEEEENLLSQLLEEQNRLCECRTELAKAKGYLSELFEVITFGRRFKHNLSDEIEAFLKGEKKDECGNV